MENLKPDTTNRKNLRGHLLNRYGLLVAVVLVVTAAIASVLQRELVAFVDTESSFIIRNIPLLFIAAVMLSLLAGLLFWLATTRELIRPLEQLVDTSEVIRWRGYLGEDERRDLAILSSDPSHIGALAQSLLTMEQENNRRFAELRILLETGRVVASSLNVDDVIDSLLEQMQSLFHIERCAVISLDERTGIFNMVASRGMGDYPSRYNVTTNRANLPSYRALQSGKPVQIVDTETDLAFMPHRPRARQEGFRSVLAIPLQTFHAPPAVMILYQPEPYYYSYSELELASNFAHHATVALDNAALYGQTDERLQEQTRRLEAIVESMRDGLLLESLTGEILYCNQQISHILDVSAAEAKGQSALTLTAPLLENAHHVTDQTLELTQLEQDWRIHRFDVTDVRGELVGRGQVWQDITQDKQLDRMKSTLVSTVSHELRTPLATIKGYATTLLADDVAWDETAQREFLQTISDETDRLTKLVQTLLDMSRIEGGTLAILAEPRDVNHVVRETVRQFPAETFSRIQFDLHPDLEPVTMDAPRISTAVRNLIENAVKYAPADSPIDLTTDRSDSHVLIAVRDYGNGVPEGMEERIFGQFFRADNGYTRQTGGVGLGLAICRGFIEAHNGTILVENCRPGAKFTIQLPIVD